MCRYTFTLSIIVHIHVIYRWKVDRKSEREKCYYRRNDSLWLITFAVRTGAWPPWTTGIKIFDGPVPRLSTVLSRAASNTKFQNCGT